MCAPFLFTAVSANSLWDFRFQQIGLLIKVQEIPALSVKAQIESMQAEAAAKEEEVPVAEPVEDAATETVEEEKTEAAGGSEEAPEAE